MKTKVLSLTLAGVMSLQNTVFAADSRIDGVGDQQVLAAQRELMILRHDIQRLDESLVEAAQAIQARKDNGNFTASVAVGGAVLGLGMAALSMTVSKLGADSGAGVILSMTGYAIVAVKTASSSALSLVSEVQKGKADTKEAKEALFKARQEIMAARTSAQLNEDSMNALTELDNSLAKIQTSLEEYKDRENLDKGMRLTSVIAQAAGAAITFYAGASILTGNGISNRAATLGPALMTIGNILSINSALLPSKADAVLKEITKIREDLAIAAAKLQ